MDLREKLIELLKEAEMKVTETLSVAMELDEWIGIYADHLIEKGVTVQEWIPVTESPKERGRYLCYFKYEPESPDVIFENTYYGTGHWMSEKDRITHWAYLPEPPKGD